MRHSYSVVSVVAVGLLALAGAGAASAQDEGTGSWIDLFDGETTFGWTVLGTGEWEAAEGLLTCEDGAGGWVATNAQFQDFELTAKIKVTDSGTSGIALRAGFDGHPAYNGGTVVPIDPSEAFQDVRIVAQGGTIMAEIDGEAVEVEAGSNTVGHIGFLYHRYHRDRRRPRLHISDVKLRPLAMAPIFDGETLDGWNIIPDRQSKFAVVDGAINITDGNGQIETDALYENFLLQIDVISNGEHLNSGVFFRGPKGEFWRGLESQVRNQWTRDDRTRPVDFGTGGLYGVQEARQVVSTDGEYFTKTIIANGNHFAVWVNGYLVSDFFDTREPNRGNDGKNGFVQDAGTIHLQGHDPTTDLSFKNILIQEYE